MKDLHAKFLQALELQKEQIQAVQESKAADGKAKGEATKKLFDEINQELSGKDKITIPKNLTYSCKRTKS